MSPSPASPARNRRGGNKKKNENSNSRPFPPLMLFLFFFFFAPVFLFTPHAFPPFLSLAGLGVAATCRGGSLEPTRPPSPKSRGGPANPPSSFPLTSTYAGKKGNTERRRVEESRNWPMSP